MLNRHTVKGQHDSQIMLVSTCICSTGQRNHSGCDDGYQSGLPVASRSGHGCGLKAVPVSRCSHIERDLETLARRCCLQGKQTKNHVEKGIQDW